MSIVSGSLGAVMGSNATVEASENAKKAQDEATAAQERMYEKTRTDFEPYRNMTTEGGDNSIVSNYKKMLTGGYNMEESPSAKYARTQGAKSLNRQLAARGLLGSGNAAQRLAELESGIASNDYTTRFNMLSNALNVGTSAAAHTASAGSQLSSQYGEAAGNIGNAAINAGNARASLYSGLGGASANTANTAINAYRAWNPSSAGAGGGYEAGAAGSGYGYATSPEATESIYSSAMYA